MNRSMPAHSPRIVVAGFGLLSPLGLSAWETFTALLAGRTLADRAAALPHDVAPVDLVRAVGAVASAQHGADDPAVELAERAAREACHMAGADPAGLRTFLGTSKGAVGEMSDSGGWHRQDSSKRCLAVALGPHGYLTHRLRQRLGLGVVRHDVAACASSLTALHHAHRWLATAPQGLDQPQAALVVTCEAALTGVFIHSYGRLGVLAPTHPQTYRQRPLDRSRQGFVLSEMGAAVVLRRLPPGSEPTRGQIELVDSAIACEAEDLIRPSPTMPALRHIADRLLHRPVDMIHPHAPGTVDHDPVELAVYRSVLARRASAALPDVYASKGALGHPLGAAGLSSLVLACLCLIAGRRPAMPWLTHPLAEAESYRLSHTSPTACRRTGRHAVFAAGFAGHVAGALIQRH